MNDHYGEPWQQQQQQQKQLSEWVAHSKLRGLSYNTEKYSNIYRTGRISIILNQVPLSILSLSPRSGHLPDAIKKQQELIVRKLDKRICFTDDMIKKQTQFIYFTNNSDLYHLFWGLKRNFMKQSVIKYRWTNFCNLCVFYKTHLRNRLEKRHKQQNVCSDFSHIQLRSLVPRSPQCNYGIKDCIGL